MAVEPSNTNITTAALIPARGGSKSVPEKNLRELGGKPLVAWPIGTAKATPAIDDIYVTTDDTDIAEAAEDHGAEVIKRPTKYAEDDSLVVDAIIHAIDKLSEKGDRPEQMVLLEPTCPFRSVEDIEDCLKCLDNGYDSAATFVEASVNPHRTWRLEEGEPTTFIDEANPWLPRQSLPSAFQLSGGCYAFETAAAKSSEGPSLLFGESAGIEMPPERSIDIDSRIDLEVARAMITEEMVDPA